MHTSVLSIQDLASYTANVHDLTTYHKVYWLTKDMQAQLIQLRITLNLNTKLTIWDGQHTGGLYARCKYLLALCVLISFFVNFSLLDG